MEKRVYFYDTDAGGVVYYGNYLQYLEEARTEFLENRDLCLKNFHDRNLFYAVSHCDIHYRSPARYGEILDCDASLKKVSAVKLIFHQDIRERLTKRLIVEAEVTLVCLGKDFKPVALPDDLKEKLTA